MGTKVNEVICIWIMVKQDVFHDRDTHLINGRNSNFLN